MTTFIPGVRFSLLSEEVVTFSERLTFETTVRNFFLDASKVAGNILLETLCFPGTMVKKIWQENCLFRRVRKIAISDGSFVVSVRMRQLGSHWTDFYEML